MRICACFSLVALLVPPTGRASDKVTLKSGKILRGTVTHFEDGILHIRKVDGSVRKGNISDVEKIVFDRSGSASSREGAGPSRTNGAPSVEALGTAAPRDKTAAMQAKLRSIVLPTIKFQETAIPDAVRFLRRRSVELDPDGEGVNILLQLPADTSGRTVTMDMDSIALGEAIRYICMAAGLRFRVEANAVVVTGR